MMVRRVQNEPEGRTMRFAFMRFAVVALLTTAFSGCGDDVSGPETDLLHLQGTVVDAATEVPIEGAQIILQWSAGAFRDRHGMGGDGRGGAVRPPEGIRRFFLRL